MTGQGRTLTDDDIDAIVTRLIPAARKAVVTDFYQEFGRGLWAWSIKVLIAVIIIVGLRMGLDKAL